ncbi:hypothetical protein E0J20_09440 [Rhizobium leguminosarum bv. viciae]|nr:hypothetical protein E0J20_09440 [Rhizobium leguminosarum bv. viciae]
MLRMTFDNIDTSFCRAATAYREVKAALIAEAGEDQADFIEISGNVFMSLVLSDQPLAAANCYYLKQGWKLAMNYGLRNFMAVDRSCTSSDAYCDLIEAAFRYAIVRAIDQAYKHPANRKDNLLRLAWERYGYHDAKAEQIAA